MEGMGDRVLVFEKPIDSGFLAHRFANRLGHGFAMGAEQDLVIDLFLGHSRIEPDRDNDAQIVGFLLGDITGSHGIEDSVGDSRLHGTHEDVRVFVVGDGDLADHDGDRADLDITVKDCEDLGVSLALITHELSDRLSDGAIKFTDDDFGFGGRPSGFIFDQGFTGTHHDSLRHGKLLFEVDLRESRKDRRCFEVGKGAESVLIFEVETRKVSCQPEFRKLGAALVMMEREPRVIPSRFAWGGNLAGEVKAMSRVILSENTIRIPNPVVFPALLRLVAGGAVAGLVAVRSEAIMIAWERAQSFLRSPSTEGFRVEVLLGEWLPVVFFLLAAVFAAAFALVAVLHSLLQLTRLACVGGTNAFAGAPGVIDRGPERAYELFTNRAISRPLADTPPFMARTILGSSAYWISPSAGALLGEWNQVTGRLFRWGLVLVVPALLPPGWSVAVAKRCNAPQETFAVIEQVESALRWPVPMTFMAIASGLWGAYLLASLLIRGKQPRVHVVESRTVSRSAGNPTDYYHFVMDRLHRLQHLSCPNRPIGSEQLPRIGTIRTGQGGDFVGVRTIETQPLPIASGRSLPMMMLTLAGSVLMVTGFGILLFDPVFSLDRSASSGWLPSLAAAAVGIVGGRRAFRAGLQLAHTFRFHSDLVRIEVKGTYTADRLGAGDGRGGLLYAESIAVQSNCHVTLHASRLITEVVPSAGSWHPVAEAMEMPRTIVDTTAAADFTTRIEALLQSLDGYESEVRLASVDKHQGGLRELVSINQAINEASIRLQAPALQGATIHLPQHAATSFPEADRRDGGR